MNEEEIILRTLTRETSFEIPIEKVQAIFEKYKESSEMKELQKEREKSLFTLFIKNNIDTMKGLNNLNSLDETEPA